MKLMHTLPAWLRAIYCLGTLFAFAGAASASADATPPALGGPEAIVSSVPQKFRTEGRRLSGQLVVATELISQGADAELLYAIIVEPLHGQVALAGGEDEDSFQTKSGRLGYFSYQPREGYVGEDSFSYTVLNENTGRLFRNTVVIDVKPAPPVMLEKFVVSGARENALTARPVTLRTRPNEPVTSKLPSHEDFMGAAARAEIASPKVSYVLDEKARPQHGAATLDRATGRLTYAPNPDFFGEDSFKYYTLDENNAQLGVVNSVTVSVEPIRDFKKMTVDRTKSRQVDLVFVINNSPSMAPHQQRIAENLRRFRRLFDEKGLDYRIGVLTTDFVNAEQDRAPGEQAFFKNVRTAEIDRSGHPVLDRNGRPQKTTKRVESNGALVTLPIMDQPWVTPQTPDGVFAELVKVGTNGDSNRTAFTAVYNLVADYSNGQHALLRPDATTVVVFFMDEEETRMASWRESSRRERRAEWIEDGTLPELLARYNRQHPGQSQTLDSYIKYWVLRPFILIKGNKRGKIEMDAVVTARNISHRRAAELTGGTVMDIEGDFSGPLAALGDRIADTVAVALDPVAPGARLYQKSLRVVVDGQEVSADPKDGFTYDALTHSIRFQGAAKKKAFAARIEITYEEHR